MEGSLQIDWAKMQKIIDSHVHFWNPSHLRYQWLDKLPPLNRPFLPEDLPKQGQNWQVDRLVFVQADCLAEQGLREVAWISSLAANDATIAGIVAFAPLELGDKVQASLEALQSYPLVKGIRRLIQSEALGFSTAPDFVNAVRLLPQFDYSFDICIKSHQLIDILRLVKQCPNVEFILDHCGKPDIKAGQLERWKTDIAQLAQYPNVSCKLCGLVTEADHEHWQASDLKPYIEHVFTCFGADRMLFGSDWPVLQLATQYDKWIALLQDVTNGFSEAARNSFFYKNTQRLYKLCV
jgi:L-fuconolactonase